MDLEIASGEFIVFVGPSGCGKSTLLRLIAGLEELSSGNILFDKADVTTLPAGKREVAMVFQSYALYPHMTAAQNLSFGLRMTGHPAEEIARRVERAVNMLRLEDYLHRKPSQLSGGQCQRVAIGRALVQQPKVFLFDEPLSNLDAKLRVDMRTEIKKRHQNLGTTIVYVTHDQIEAMTLSSRIAVMTNGYMQQLGTPQDIYDNPQNIFVATFMGSPAMNLIPAVVRALDDGSVAEISLYDGSLEHLPFGHAGMNSWDGREILLGLRPEMITDEESADRKSPNIARIMNRIELTEPAGSDTFISMPVGGKSIVARMKSDIDVKPDQIFPFAINMDKAVIFDPVGGNRIQAKN